MKETLELKEAAKKYKDLWLPDDHYDAFIAGAKWQAERVYTEEEVREAIRLAHSSNRRYLEILEKDIIQSLKLK
jgi:response regulator of citrate/malate metabolism